MIENSLSILALGDSYTIGEGVSENERWPNQLSVALEKIGIKTLKPEIIAQTGWTTGELIHAIEKKNITTKYDLVFLLIGVNNQYRGYALGDYRKEFLKLLSMAIRFSKQGRSRVFVLSIPDWGNTYFAEGRDKDKITIEIDAFNKINMEESENSMVNYINITDITRLPLSDSTLLASDGLHPSVQMYTLWVERLLTIFDFRK